jgi:hypothetical protein
MEKLCPIFITLSTRFSGDNLPYFYSPWYSETNKPGLFSIPRGYSVEKKPHPISTWGYIVVEKLDHTSPPSVLSSAESWLYIDFPGIQFYLQLYDKMLEMFYYRKRKLLYYMSLVHMKAI